MGLTKTLLHENFYHNSNEDILLDAEYQEFCFEQKKNQNKKAQRVHSGRGDQDETRSPDTFYALRKPKNN